MSVGASDSACVPGAPSLGISNSCRRSADIVRCLLRKSYPLHRHLHAALYPSAHSHSKHHVASSSFQHRFRDAHAPANCRPRRSRGDVWVSSPLQRPASLRPAASGLLLRPKQPPHRPVMHRTRTHHVYTQARAQMHRNTNNVSRSTATCDVVCVRVMNIFSQGKKKPLHARIVGMGWERDQHVPLHPRLVVAVAVAYCSFLADERKHTHTQTRAHAHAHAEEMSTEHAQSDR